MEKINVPYSGFKLLMDLTEYKDPFELREIISEAESSYTIASIKKRSGGIRKLSIPSDDLKEFQGRFLRMFLRRIEKRGLLDEDLTAGKSKGPIVNAHIHNFLYMGNVIKIDLKDAYTSVKDSVIIDALRSILVNEVNECRELAKKRAEKRISFKNYPRPPILSNRKVPWFRWLIRQEGKEYLINTYIEDFLSELKPLITNEGCLPQGPPTSPFLMALVLTHLNVINDIKRFLSENTKGKCLVTIYADDIVISSSSDQRDKINEIIEIIESNGILKVNKEKTRVYSKKRGGALITGLRVSEQNVSGEKLSSLINTMKKKSVRKKARQNLEQNKSFKVSSVGFPKKIIKKVRGIINRAIYDKTLTNTAKGYISLARGVYKNQTMPNQLKKVISKFENNKATS
ncbi:MAG: reverse transcriptase domain-containing protein [Patescibacteria group bacterium]|nr:MAG: reverse transcriptase domain-containing protein [Patescibacteria group bacterium]